MDLLTTYTHNLELQAITAPLLITIAPAKTFSSLLCVFTSHSMITAYNSGDSSASRSQVLYSQSPLQN
jgi:hypothetical protein